MYVNTKIQNTNNNLLLTRLIHKVIFIVIPYTVRINPIELCTQIVQVLIDYCRRHFRSLLFNIACHVLSILCIISWMTWSNLSQAWYYESAWFWFISDQHKLLQWTLSPFRQRKSIHNSMQLWHKAWNISSSSCKNIVGPPDFPPWAPLSLYLNVERGMPYLTDACLSVLMGPLGLWP